MPTSEEIAAHFGIDPTLEQSRSSVNQQRLDSLYQTTFPISSQQKFEEGKYPFPIFQRDSPEETLALNQRALF